MRNAISFLFSWDRGASKEDRQATKAITGEKDAVIWGLNTRHSAAKSAALCVDTKEKLKMAARTLAIREDFRNGLKQEENCSHLEAEMDC